MTSKAETIAGGVNLAPPLGAGAPFPAAQSDYLIAMAARAPSVHNTQPWRFKVGEDAIELYADPRRKLRVDPSGREMLISCGAALFGLRLGVRSLGYLTDVTLLPDPGSSRLLARVRPGAVAPMTTAERRMLEALPHRHTHRGPFACGPLPRGLLAGLQHDALAEKAAFALVAPAARYRRLADIVANVSRRLDLDPLARADVREWSRPRGNTARDGVPAQAFPPGAAGGRLRQRDFDLGRGIGLLPADGGPAAVTAVLVTRDDSVIDWLRAGQALHRLLLHAAAQWVFASLYSQPLEAAGIRSLIRTQLGLPGVPQMLLQFGLARTTQATARRPPGDLAEPQSRSLPATSRTGRPRPGDAC
jgi:nitroreductase